MINNEKHFQFQRKGYLNVYSEVLCLYNDFLNGCSVPKLRVYYKKQMHLHVKRRHSFYEDISSPAK